MLKKKLLLLNLFLLSVSFLSAKIVHDFSKITLDTFICDSVKSVRITPDGVSKTLIADFDYVGYHDYYLQYRTNLDTVWKDTYGIIAGNPGKLAYKFTDVQTCTKYQLRVRTFCYQVNVYTSWVTSPMVSLIDCSSQCPKPYVVNTKFYKDSTGLFANFGWVNDFNINHDATLSVISDDNLFKQTVTTKEAAAKINIPLCKKFKISLQFNCGGVKSLSFDTVSKPLACFCSKPEYISPATSFLNNGGVNPIVSTDLYFSSDIYYPQYKELLTVTSEDGTYKKVISSDTLMNYGGYFTRLNLPSCKKFTASLQYTCSATQKSDTTNVDFITYGCPPPCQNLTEIKAGVYSNDTVAYVSWGNYFGLKNAKVTVTATDNSFTKTIATIDTIVQINLTKCKNFKATLQYDCDTVSGKKLSANFSTTGCVANNCRKPYNFQADRFPDTVDSTLRFSWTNDSTLRYDVAIIIYSKDSSYQKTYYTTDNQIKIKFPFCGTFLAKLQYKCAGKYIDVAPFLPYDFYNFCQTNPCHSTSYTNIFERIYSDDTVAIVNWKKYSNKDTVLIRISAIDSSFYYKVFTTDTAFKISLPKCKTFTTFLNYKCDTIYGISASFPILSTGKCNDICSSPSQFYVYPGDTTLLTWKSDLNQVANSALRIYSSDSSFSKTFNISGDLFARIVLPPCTNLKAELSFKCGNKLSTLVTNEFKTVNCILPCNMPTFFSHGSYADDTVIVFHWTPPYNSAKIDTSFLTVSSIDGTFKKIITSTTNNAILKLRTCTTYNVMLRAKCGTRFTDSLIYKFSTNCYSSYDPCRSLGTFHFDDINGGGGLLSYGSKYNYKDRILVKLTSSDGIINKTISKTDSTGTIYFQNLLPCKTYTATLQYVCGLNSDILSTPAYVYFTPRFCDSTYKNCAIITQTSVSTDSNNAIISWSASSANNIYQVQYKLASDNFWSNLYITSSLNYTLKNLQPCNNYIVRIRPSCDTIWDSVDGINSTWSEIRFKPGTNCLRGDHSSVISSARATISVSPNPGSGNPSVIYKLESAGTVKMDVINLYGSVLEIFNAGELPAGEYNYNFTKLENLPAGLYLVRLHTDGEISQSVKWVKE